MSKSRSLKKKKKTTTKSKPKDGLMLANQEIKLLKTEIDFRDEKIARQKEKLDKMRLELTSLDDSLKESLQEQKDSYKVLSERNNQMRNVLEREITSQQEEIKTLKNNVGGVTEKMVKGEEEMQKEIDEKKLLIEDQTAQISCMALEFESMVNVHYLLTQDTIDLISKKIQQASEKWTNEVNLSVESQKLINQT